MAASSERKSAQKRVKELERLLDAANQRTRTILESITDGFMVLDKEWRLAYFNEAVARISGMKREDMLGECLWELFPHATSLKFYRELHRAVENHTPVHFEEFYPGPVNRWLDCHCYPSEKGLAVYLRDITRRKKAEEALFQAEEQLRLASEAAGFGTYYRTFEPFRMEWSNQLKRMFGLPEDAPVGIDEAMSRIHPEDRARVYAKMEASLDPEGTGNFDDEHRIVRTDGKVRWFHMKGRTEFSKGKPVRAYGAVNDITRRKKTFQALRALTDSLEQRVAERTALAETRAKQLQALVTELTLAEERERRRLAEILHDHLQQFLVAAKINTEVLSESIGRKHKPEAGKVIELIDRSLEVSRSLTVELSPPVLRRDGLSAALKCLASWMLENDGLTVELQTNAGLDPQREEITVLLFLSIRELLFNVVKHSGVKSARLEMALDEEHRLRVSVIDRGAGFEPDAIWEKAQAGIGFGLINIRERLTLLGGSLEVESSPGKGAVFSLVVPFEKTCKRNKP